MQNIQQLESEKLKSFKSILKEGKEKIKNTYFQTYNAKKLLLEHSNLIDKILCELWNIFLINSFEKHSNYSERYYPALVAVGGYGRQELYPHSDIDLLIILAQSADKDLSENIENLITTLWDLGLKIGHSVRTIPECLYDSKNDITVQTSFLDSRFLTGNLTLFFAFQSRFKGQLDPLKFLHDKQLERNERHQRFENTPYNLEPNIKESPGALRDIHLIYWIGKSLGLQNIPNDFLQYDLMAEDGVKIFNKSYEFLQHLRINLHYYKNREEDRLLFDYQEQIATSFHKVDNGKNCGYFSDFYTKNNYQNLVENVADNIDDNPKILISKFMQIYYRCVKSVMLINTLFGQNISTFLEPETMLSAKMIDDEFQQIGNLLDVKDISLFFSDNTAIFRAFLTLQKYAKSHNLVGMTAPTLRALWMTKNKIARDKKTLIEFRNNKINQQNFLNLFTAKDNIYPEIRRLNQLEILSLYLPIFGNIVGQMQYDLFHVYTVDQHSLEALKNLRKFSLAEYAHEYPQCSNILDEFERPYILYLAALFHDIAKGRGGDHSELGAIDAENFCQLHSAVIENISGSSSKSQEDQQLLIWLVKYHLVFSKVAQKQDLSEPEVIIKFADFVKTKRNLDALYLLTHADIRATSPKVWNQWKNKLLSDLYNLTNQELLLRSQNNNDSNNNYNVINKNGIIAEKQQQALNLLRYFALPESVHERLWNQLDNVYFLRHSAEEIAWHTKYLHYRIFDKKPIIAARKLSVSESEVIAEEYNNNYIFQVMVYTPNTNELFSKLVGYFAKNNFSIVDAKIHTTIHKYALDSFTLLNLDNDLQEFDEKSFLENIENDLFQRLNNIQTFDDVPNINNRFIMSRQVKNFPIKPTISIRRDASYFHYILNLSAVDKPGLLYLISKELASNNIVLHSAKITTLGERAEDVFLISGQGLEDETFRIQLERKLIRVID